MDPTKKSFLVTLPLNKMKYNIEVVFPTTLKNTYISWQILTLHKIHVR